MNRFIIIVRALLLVIVVLGVFNPTAQAAGGLSEFCLDLAEAIKQYKFVAWSEHTVFVPNENKDNPLLQELSFKNIYTQKAGNGELYILTHECGNLLTLADRAAEQLEAEAAEAAETSALDEAEDVLSEFTMPTLEPIHWFLLLLALAAAGLLVASKVGVTA